MKKELVKLRKAIDKLDRNIIKLLVERAKISSAIGQLKTKENTSIYCPDREQYVLRRVSQLVKPPLTSKAVTSIYREIMSSSLALEKPLVIAYLGPAATFTHQAALKKFGSLVNYQACDSISSVFVEVEKNNADYGVVPIENSIEGAVTHTLDMFIDSDLKICAQILLEISHNLLSHFPIGEVERIYSHPMVFGQCRLWLQKNLPKAQLIEVSSTTHAAQEAAKQKKSAAIASTLAAELYQLPIIAHNIQDSGHNITRFFVIGKTQPKPTGHDKTSLMFSIKDKVGALYEMLEPFKRFGVNLSKIESRPSKKKAWDYYFFIDLEGHQNHRYIKKSLEILEGRCKFLKILGSYPASEDNYEVG
ncbi:MAG: prephenate dehydratase [Candidatus Omnitrophica bacterium]|nr:prephenate dehydratase [Candidatus Omnitrophota bacterium]